MNVFQMQEIARQRNEEIDRATRHTYHARTVSRPSRLALPLWRSRAYWRVTFGPF